MPAKKKVLQNDYSSINLVSETYSIIDTKAAIVNPLDATETTSTLTSKPEDAVDQGRPVELTEAQKLVRKLNALLNGQPATILSGAQIAKLPSSARCLEHGFIFSYLMPGFWLLCTVEYVHDMNAVFELRRSLAAEKEANKAKDSAKAIAEAAEAEAQEVLKRKMRRAQVFRGE